MIDCWLGIGANIGNPLKQLQQAATALSILEDSVWIAGSGIYCSPPLGPQDQPDYLNACVHMRTRLAPKKLLKALKQIEKTMGRCSTRRWGERVIDLDILLYGDAIITDTELTIPHPGIEYRAFVIVPLSEITPANFTLPGGRSLAELRNHIDDNQLVQVSPRLEWGITA